ncbi:MAG: glycosyltransferase [Acinetobacter populi]|uniref:glycosyltransferase n=1 Tax=Acinetobacter populi TaxID=1582270 RepID=UPI00235663A0|nr:glycosyltransferase [Acinetobacter populi]MCH4247891.1 glycosyltransferase [Acinetobacter populi]
MNEIKITEGNLYITRNVDITIIVISIDSDHNLVESISSIIQNKSNFNVQIIIVNTGKPGVKNVISGLSDHVLIIENEQKKFVGYARNIGIKESKAEIISFLASDCRITQHWIKNRLDLHKKQRVVSSSLRPVLTNNRFQNLITWGSYIVTHFYRIPEITYHKAAKFGLSYHRSIFDQFGLFDESARVGEDTILNNKISSIESIKWNPEVITLHTYPYSLMESILDQFRRGQRESRYICRYEDISIFYFFIKQIYDYSYLIYHALFKIKNRNISRAILIVVFLIFFRLLGNLFFYEKS